MLKDTTQYLYTYIDFLHKHYTTAEKLENLHPIDHLLAIALPSVGIKWFQTLRNIGIDYNTPCIRIQNAKDRLIYSEDGWLTMLTVSNNAYLITSQKNTFIKEGKVLGVKEIFKDKDRLRNCMVCFNHSISTKEYIKTVI